MRRNRELRAVGMTERDVASSRLSPLEIICPSNRFQASDAPVTRIVPHARQSFIGLAHAVDDTKCRIAVQEFIFIFGLSRMTNPDSPQKAFDIREHANYFCPLFEL